MANDTQTIGTDRIGGVSVNPTVPNADGTPYDAGKAATASNPIASSGVRRYSGDTPEGTSAYDAAGTTYFGSGQGANRGPVDENAIRSSALQAVNAQVDAIDNTYANLVSNAQIAGQGRLGATRAVNARAGTLGSDFGNAAIDKTQAANDQEIKALQDTKDANVQAILSQANKDADARIATEKTAVDKNNSDYISFLKTQGDNASAQLKAYAESGGSLDELTDKEYNHFLSATGMSDAQVKAFVALNKPKDTILHQEVQGNKYIQVSKDPITGKTTSDVIDLGFNVPQDYKPTTLTDGSLIFTPSKIDPTKPIASQVLHYTPNSPVKGSQKGPSASEQKTETDGVNWLYRQPGFTAADKQKFTTDPSFHAWVLRQVQLEGIKDKKDASATYLPPTPGN